MSGKKKSKKVKAPSPQRKQQPGKVKARDIARRALSFAQSVDQKLISFVQAFQQNLNQLYMNQKAVADMGYTNNVHVHVIRKFIQEKLDISDEEYKKACDLENAAREELQRQQEEEQRKHEEELKQKQAEAASKRLSSGEEPLASEGEDQPVIFGGDAGTTETAEEESEDAEGFDQGEEDDEVPEVQERTGAGDPGEDEGERGEESLPL